MDIAEIAAQPRGTEFYLRVTGVGAANEPGWFNVTASNRAGAPVRQVSHLDIECLAPVRPIAAGETVFRDKAYLPRKVLFVHGDVALVEAQITNRVELVPLAELSRTQRVL